MKVKWRGEVREGEGDKESSALYVHVQTTAYTSANTLQQRKEE